MPSAHCVTYTDDNSVGKSALNDLIIGENNHILACNSSRINVAKVGDIVVNKAKGRKESWIMIVRLVERADNLAQGYGNHIVIKHGFGFETLYGHMSKFKARAGQRVKRGEVIGYVGSTGLSTAPHLHYEVIKNGEKINPINYFYNDITPAQYQQLIELASRANQSFD